jgi:hypothetical protein
MRRSIMKRSWFLQIGIALILAVMSFLFCFHPAFAEDTQLEIINGPFTIQPDPDADNALVALILVRNNGPAIQQLTFRAINDDGQEILISQPEQQGIGGYTIQEYSILIIDQIAEKTTGWLIISGENIGPASAAITINPSISPLRFLGIQFNVNTIILYSFLVGVIGFLIILLVVMLIQNKKGAGDVTEIKSKKITTLFELKSILHYRVSGLVWDITKNWASTFVAVGGILGTILGSKLMPESPLIISLQNFQLLNMIFLFLIALGPFLIEALNALGIEPRDGNGKIIVDINGNVPLLLVPYILGSSIVVWAILGELITLAILIQELFHSGVISGGFASVAQISLVGLGCLGYFYSIEKVIQNTLTAPKITTVNTERISRGSRSVEIKHYSINPEHLNRPSYLP